MVAGGVDPLAEKMKNQQVPDFATFVEETYLPWSKKNKKSYKMDVYAIDHLKPVFGKFQLSAISTKDIRQYLEKRKTMRSGATCNRTKSLLSAIFRVGIELEIISENPCKGIKKYKESSGKERFMSNEEVARFLEVLDSYGDRVVAYFMKYLLFTGQRKGETQQLAWKDVDFEKQMVHLHQEQTKNGKSRYVQLNSMALGVLEKLKAMGNNGPWVFPGNVKGHHLVNHNKFFIELKEKAGLEKSFRTHDLRHSFASLAIASGCSLFEVQNLLGHSDPSQTNRYSHLSSSAIKQASEGVATVINDAIG
jgi:integrase